MRKRRRTTFTTCSPSMEKSRTCTSILTGAQGLSRYIRQQLIFYLRQAAFYDMINNHCNYFRDTLWWSMRPSKRRRLPKITWMDQKSVDRPSTLTGVSSLDQRSTRRAAAGGDEVKKDCKILTFKLCIPLLSFECNLICLKRLEKMQHHRHRNLA